jgi:tetratricopeptide (TPR) repeat protein
MKKWLMAMALLWMLTAAVAAANELQLAEVLTPVATQGSGTPLPVRRNLSLPEQARAAEFAFNDGKYAEAAGLYEKVADQAPFDPAVLYNLATAYAKSGQRGLAIWRYLQAEKLMPRDRDIHSNLAVLGYRRESVLPFPLNRIFAQMTGNQWTALAAVATFSSLLLLLGTLMASRGNIWRGRLRQAAWLVGLLAVIAWPFAAGHYYLEEIAQHGVVVTENSVMRTGPNINQVSTYGLAPGSVVRIRERRNDGWLKISFGTGYVGFIEADHVRNL